MSRELKRRAEKKLIKPFATRIRTVIGQVNNPKYAGKWFVHLTLCEDSGIHKPIDKPYQFGPFDTKKEAVSCAERNTKLVKEKIEATLIGEL